MDTSATGTGKRGRAPDDAAETSGEKLGTQGKRCRVGDLHPASVTQTEVLEGHAQLRNPDLKSRLDATQAPAAGGVEARNRVLGEKWTGEEEKAHGDLANAAK